MNQVIRVTEGWHRAQEGQQCWTWVPQKYQYQMKFSFPCQKRQDSEVTYEPPHLTWQEEQGQPSWVQSLPAAGTKQRDQPLQEQPILYGNTSPPFSRGRGGRSEALPAPLGAGISYPAHEDDGVEGSFPDEKQEGPVGIEDFSVQREGTARDGDSCSS